MKSTQFFSFYNQLNPEQKIAVDTIEGPVMVIAGPGTGKTQILTLRIANILLKTQVNPEQILALTFTESGVVEMRNRLLTIIGKDAYRVHISTFHGFCNDLIQAYPEYFENFIAREPLSDLEQITILENIIDSTHLTLLKPFGVPYFYVEKLKEVIQELKKENVIVNDFSDAVDKQEQTFLKRTDSRHEKGRYKGQMKGEYVRLREKIAKNRELIVVYRQYEEILRQSSRYDYQDMLLSVIEAFGKFPDFLLQQQERFQYLLVDEHQDTNLAQNKIVELLCSFFDEPNLFVVGDEKQAIYRFQGASLENFLYFQNKYSLAKLIHLKRNYRSTDKIVEGAGSMIAHNESVRKKLLGDQGLISESKGSQQLIDIVPCENKSAQEQYVVSKIEALRNKGVLYREMAIIGRNNNELEDMVHTCELRNIPYYIETNKNILFNREIEKLLHLLSTISRVGYDSELVVALHFDIFQIPPLDVYRLIQESKKAKKTVWDYLENGLPTDTSIRKDSWEKMKQVVDNCIYLKKESYRLPFDAFFVKVVNETKYIQTLFGKPNSLALLSQVTALYEDIKIQVNKQYPLTLDSYLSYIESLREHGIGIFWTSSGKEDAVRIMTAHKSKGREFDHVFILKANDRHWGNKRKMTHGFLIPWEHLQIQLNTVTITDQLEDERRLFYVAITRARLGVSISYLLHDDEGKVQVPSQFIEEIDPKYKNILPVQSLNHSIFQPSPQLAENISMSSNKSDYRDFVKGIFQENGLSVTGLNNYLICPWRFFYRNIVRLPDVKTDQSILGTAIHHIINEFIRQRDKKKHTLPELLSLFEESLRKEGIDAGVFDNLMKEGSLIIPLIYEQKLSQFDNSVKAKLRIHSIYFNDVITLNGEIDMYRVLQGNSIQVHDFKTAKPISRNQILGKNVDKKGEDYFRQLVFYRILFEGYRNGLFQVVSGVIDFLKPTEKKELISERFDITANDTKELRKTIEQVTNEIFELTFWDKVCDDKECAYCKIRSYMV